MAEETTLEQKRKEAKCFAGVSYDNRTGLFTAAITIKGVKKYLGSFVTAALASEAYGRARAAHPIQRLRSDSDSIRQRMFEFSNMADYIENKVVPGQRFSAPDGQLFRVEGVDQYLKREWYVCSSRCRACGDLFEQFVSINLDSVVSLTRNCTQHHGVRDGKVWPEPVEWQIDPRVFPARPNTVRTKINSTLKTSAFVATPESAGSGVEFLPGHWDREKRDFAREYSAGISGVTIEQIEKAYVMQQEISNGLLLEEKADVKEKEDADFDVKTTCVGTAEHAAALARQAKVYGRVSARLEDTIAIAEDLPKDNSDLA